MKRLGDEYRKALLAKVVADARLAALAPALAAVEYGVYGWEEKYKNAMAGGRADG